MKIIVIIAFLVSASILTANASPQEVEFKKDAAYIYRVYLENHVNPYLWCDSTRLDSVYRAYVGKINGHTKKRDFFRLTREFFSYANDGHTSLLMTSENFGGLFNMFFFNRYITIKLEKHGRTVFVKNVFKGDSGKTYRLISIGSLSTDSLIKSSEKWTTYRKRDKRYANITDPNNLGEYLYLFHDIKGKCRIQVEDTAGKRTVEGYVKGVNLVSRRKYVNSRYGDSNQDIFKYFSPIIGNTRKNNFQGKKLSKTLLDGSILSSWYSNSLNAGLVSIKSLEYDNVNVKKALDTTFTYFRRKGIKNLIIDLRGNSGGDLMFGYDLAPYLTAGSFSLLNSLTQKVGRNDMLLRLIKSKDSTAYRQLMSYENRTVTFIKGDSSWIDKNLISRNIVKSKSAFRPEKIFILIDIDTYSAAVLLASALRAQLPNSTLCGTATGGEIRVLGNSEPFTLPYTKWTIMVSKGFIEGIGNGEQEYLQPDIDYSDLIKRLNN